MPAQIEAVGVAQAGRPAVDVGATALTQRDGHRREVRGRFDDALRQSPIDGVIELARGHVCCRRQPQRLLGILLVADGYIDVIHQRSHDLRCRLTVVPQLGPVVEVDRGRGPGRLRRLERRIGQRPSGLRERRRDARDVEPASTAEDGLPVELLGLGLRDGRTRPVVDHGGGPLRGAGLDEVDAQAPFATDDVVGLDLHRAQRAHRRITEGVSRQSRDVARPQAVVGHRHGHVGLASGERRLQRTRLEQALMTGRLEPHHDFAERDDERALLICRAHGVLLWSGVDPTAAPLIGACGGEVTSPRSVR